MATAIINSTTFTGHAAKQPELRIFESGSKKATFSVAVKPPYGTKNDPPLWFDCEAWGATAQVCADYISKGKEVYIEGSTKIERWQDKGTGVSRSKIVILLNVMTLLGPKTSSSNETDNETQNY
jgi:single-strand DNA-binding protein